MGRPAKSVAVTNKHLTKEEKDVREETEKKLKGSSDKIKPPKYLSKTQKQVFNWIVKELKESNILSNLDVYVLATCSISIDRLEHIEDKINKEPELLFSKELLNSKDKYTKDFFRCCNELSLSPQSRAKLGTINLQAKQLEEDPILKVLRGGAG